MLTISCPDGTFTFKKASKDRGFAQMTDRNLKSLLNPKSGFLVKDCITLQCKVVVLEDRVDSDDKGEEDVNPSLSLKYVANFCT